MTTRESTAHTGIERLTRRERECLALVADHWRTKEIARQLGLSPDTVDEYIGSAVRKMAAEDRSAAARRYLAWRAADRPARAEEPVPSGGASAAVALPRSAPPLVLGRGLAIAAQWSLMTGGAAAGALLLAEALDEITAGSRAVHQLFVFLSLLSGPVILGALAVAAWKGGFAERLAAAACLTAYAFSMVLSPASMTLLVDAVLAGTLAVVAFSYRRPLLQLALGLQLLTVLSHAVALTNSWISEMAYQTAVAIWTYGVLCALVWSAFDHRRRVAG